MYKHIQTLYQTLQHVQKYTSLQKYTTNLQTYTKQSSTTFYRIVNISLQLYTNIHKYTQLNKCLQHFFFYKIVYNSTKQYTKHMNIYKTLQNSTTLLQNCTQLYKIIHK